MLAILYLILCAVFGISLVTMCVPDTARFFTACSPSKSVVSKIPPVLFTAPAGIIVGLLLVPMVNYYSISILNLAFDGKDTARRASILLTFAVFIIFTGLNFTARMRKSRKSSHSLDSKDAGFIPEYSSTLTNAIYYGLCTVILTGVASFLMFYTYRISGDTLYAGYSTFSDLAPHTAMVSSFSKGYNFPTQYMHFSGDGIQYHFFFYFLAGMLEYLGFSIDLAINIPSIIVMVCAMTLAGTLAVLFSRRRAAFILTPVLVFFRSSFNFFTQLSELRRGGQTLGQAVQTIIKSNNWYGNTPYDNWGIWAINVYPNQRHLMLGVGAMLVLIILMTPFVRRMCISLIKTRDGNSGNGVVAWLKTFAGSREAWWFRKEDPLNPIGITLLACLIAVAYPFFHGSALIGSLLVLMIMAVVSETRITYIAVAAAAVVSSFIQTKLFAGSASNVVKMQHITGFVCEDKTPTGISNYIVAVTGLTLIISASYVIYLLVRNILGKKPVYREIIYLSFLAPFVFAFNCQISAEMLANHKFIQFSLILVDIFVAGALAEMFVPPVKVKEKLPKGWYIIVRTVLIITGAALIFPLTATGISEWCVYVNRNTSCVEVNTQSNLVKWIEENTAANDVFLTPEWALNRFFLAGRPSYYAWPYYAWSAGHDTDTRETIYCWLIGGSQNNIDEFRRYCQERGIKYLIDDPEFFGFEYPNGAYYNREFFEQNLTPVAYFPEEATTIYQIY